MARLTVFGDSLVHRQGGFIDRVPFGVSMHFFGKGGMRALAVPDGLWQELLRSRPTHVFLHFGGNDISSDSSPRVIFEEIKRRVEELNFLWCTVCMGRRGSTSGPVQPMPWFKCSGI